MKQLQYGLPCRFWAKCYLRIVTFCAYRHPVFRPHSYMNRWGARKGRATAIVEAILARLPYHGGMILGCLTVRKSGWERNVPSPIQYALAGSVRPNTSSLQMILSVG